MMARSSIKADPSTVIDRLEDLRRRLAKAVAELEGSTATDIDTMGLEPDK